MDTETASLIISPLAAFAGVGFGAWLNHRLSRNAVQEERKWASIQQVQTRKEEAAARLDAAVLRALDEAPEGHIEAKNAADELQPLATRLLSSWAQNAVLDDPEIERRFFALNMTIGMASRSRNWRPGSAEPQTINLWPINVAGRELREALIYYLKRETPPAAKYPTTKQLIRIVHRDGKNGFEAINDWLIDNEIA